MAQFLRIDNQLQPPVLPCGTEIKCYLENLGLVKDVASIVWSYMDVYIESNFRHLYAEIHDPTKLIHYKGASCTRIQPYVPRHIEDYNQDPNDEITPASIVTNNSANDWVTIGFNPFEKVVCIGKDNVYPFWIRENNHLVFWSYCGSCQDCLKEMLVGRGFTGWIINKSMDGDIANHNGQSNSNHHDCNYTTCKSANIKITIKNGKKYIERLPDDYLTNKRLL